MRILRRDRPTLCCTTCQASKPAAAFYASNLSICMECKRAMATAYKRRTGYNLLYRRRKEVAK